jgi:predicted ATP-grasp superfamily ATP-dependent carboligase
VDTVSGIERCVDEKPEARYRSYRPRSSGSGFLLIAAISGRALAAAARRAGYRPLVTDMFCDTDTVTLAEGTARIPGDLQHGIDGEKLVSAMKQLAGKNRPGAVVLGSGFERKADLVDEIARHFPLTGNSGSTIRRVKDPLLLATDCAELDIPHPAFQWNQPPDLENWVTKAAGGAGGAHIRRANGEASASGRYFQRFIAGTNISALFVADGDAAHIVGFSKQWVSPAPATPYRYGGAVRLRRFDRAETATVKGWLSCLVRRASLLGLCSADFIRAKDGYRLVEINPRPGATLDIFDSDDAPLLEAHISASRGEAFRLPSFDDCMASAIAYARRPVPDFPAIDWPDWTADRQSPGTRLIAGDPICTIFARGPSVATTCRTVKTRARQLEAHWHGNWT